MNSFTIGYVCFQAVVLLIVLGILFWRKGWHAHTNTAASILTIVGVLGTFIGIFIGLQEFTISNDSNKMQESISKLLEGLKFAFGTSIVGIGSALLLKGIISPIAKHFQNEINPDENAMEKFINGLKIALEPGVIPIKLDGLTEAIKGESIETRKVLDSIKTELTNEQKEQGEQTRKTLIEMQSAIIEGQSATNTHLHSLTETVNGESIETRKVLDSIKTELTNEQKEQGEQTRKTLIEMQSAIIGEQTNNLKQLETLTTTLSEKQDALLNGTMPALTAIQDSLTDTEAGVLTKLEALTATVSDEHNKLRTKFETFSNDVAEKIANLANEELVDALKTVIDEFNTNMVNQFGDNFRHLNEAVDRMVEWQKKYRQNIEELTEKFHVATESIEKSRVSLENIVNSSSAIVERSDSIVACAEKLEPILRTMNGQLETFSELRQKVEDSLPILNENIDELTTKFSSTVQNAIDASEKSMETQRTAFNEQSEQLQSVINGLDDFTTRIDEVTQNVSTTVNDWQTGMNVQRDVSEDFMRRFVSMQETLEQELTESVNTLGGKLAALSEKFVEDYTPLTERLREVVMIAEGSRPRNMRN